MSDSTSNGDLVLDEKGQKIKVKKQKKNSCKYPLHKTNPGTVKF